MMPLHYIAVRHGESEGNVANRASRAGDDSLILSPSFVIKHSSLWRLSEIGKAQACWAGKTIKSFGFNIGAKFSSPFSRAMAGYLIFL